MTKEYPLGLPVLVLDAQTAIYDATVINSYLAQRLSTSRRPMLPKQINTV